MSLKSPLFLTAILLFLPVAQAQTSAQPRKTVERAVWTSDIEQNYGIAQQDFKDMGLGELNRDQFLNLLWFVAGREQKARESVFTESLICGRPREADEVKNKPESYDKVRVYVSASWDADEIISGVRERLRAMNGTEVVYSSGEADLKVDILAMIPTDTYTGAKMASSAVSVSVSRPCILKVGTYTSDYNDLLDQFLQVGANIHEVIGSIVSGIDTNDLENQRKINAANKKFFQQQSESASRTAR
jgi:hypothetical protein